MRLTNQKNPNTAFMIRDDLSFRSIEASVVDAGANNTNIPLLATLYCPKCKGTHWHLIKRRQPNELVCDRCGSVIECRVES
jgi:ssDNA-binding Zn-finger/Zn-ribbon topoisomerase 1